MSPRQESVFAFQSPTEASQSPTEVAKCLFMCPLCGSVWKPTITSPSLCVRGNSPLRRLLHIVLRQYTPPISVECLPAPFCELLRCFIPKQIPKQMYIYIIYKCCGFAGKSMIYAKASTVWPHNKLSWWWYCDAEYWPLGCKILAVMATVMTKASWHAGVYDSGWVILLWHWPTFFWSPDTQQPILMSEMFRCWYQVTTNMMDMKYKIWFRDGNARSTHKTPTFQ